MHDSKTMSTTDLVIIGAGGHSRSTIGVILSQTKFKIVGYLDDTKSADEALIGSIRFLGRVSDLDQIAIKFKTFAIGIGTPLAFRKKIYSTFISAEIDFPDLVHSKSILDSGVTLSGGVQIHSGAIVRFGAYLGANTIINSGAVVDHDAIVGDHSSISPNATLCGGVEVGVCTFVGAAATVLPRVKIGSNCIIGAGAVITRDVPDGKMAIGIPAKICDINEKSKFSLLGDCS